MKHWIDHADVERAYMSWVPFLFLGSFFFLVLVLGRSRSWVEGNLVASFVTF